MPKHRIPRKTKNKLKKMLSKSPFLKILQPNIELLISCKIMLKQPHKKIEQDVVFNDDCIANDTNVHAFWEYFEESFDRQNGKNNSILVSSMSDMDIETRNKILKMISNL